MRIETIKAWALRVQLENGTVNHRLALAMIHENHVNLPGLTDNRLASMIVQVSQENSGFAIHDEVPDEI